MTQIFPVPFGGTVVGYHAHFAKADGYHRVKVTLFVDANTMIVEDFNYYRETKQYNYEKEVEIVAYVGRDDEAAYRVTNFLRACAVSATRINSVNLERLRQGRVD